ncbi:MAG: glycosyltransferase, partial [Actinomyces sp.]
MPLILEIIERAPEWMHFLVVPYDLLDYEWGEEKFERSPNVTVVTPFSVPMREIYASADILIHPTFLSETYGKVVLEASLAGLPVLSSDRGNLPAHVRYTLPYDAGPEKWIEEISKVVNKKPNTIVAVEKCLNKPEKALKVVMENAERGERLTDMKITWYSANYPGVVSAISSLAALVGAERINSPEESGDMLILGGWNRQYEKFLKPGQRTWVYFCSNLAQVEMDVTNSEKELLLQLRDLYRKGMIEGLFVTEDQRWFNELVGIRAVHIPAVVPDYKFEKRDKLKGGNAACFFSPHPRKNLLVQLAACS